MTTNVFTLNVDLKKEFTSIVPSFRQGDSAQLRFKIYDEGRIVPTSTFNRAIVYSELKNGQVLQGDCEIESEYIVYNYSGLEMEFKDSFVETSLTLIDGNTQVSIKPFKVFIYKEFKPQNLTYIGILQELIKQNQDLAIDLNTLILDFESFDYSATQNYKFPNLVLYNGSTYIALKEVTGVIPNDDKVNWRLISLKGTVNTVNGILPQNNGDVILQPSSIGAANNVDLISLDERVTQQLAQTNNKIETIVFIKDFEHLVSNKGSDHDDWDWTDAIKTAVQVITDRSDYNTAKYRGGIIEFPFGTFGISSIIELPYGVIVRGAGRNSTILKSKVTSGYTLKTNKGTVIEDLTLDGALSSGNGIDIKNPIRKSVISRVDIIDFTSGVGVRLDDAYDTNFYSCEILRCQKAVEIGLNNNNDIAFYSCNFVDIYGQIAVDVQFGVAVSFYNCSWGKIGTRQQSGSYDGVTVEIKSGSGFVFISNWFEFARLGVRNVDGDNIYVQGCHFATGFETVNGSRVTLQQNDFYGYGGTIQSTGTTTNVISIQNRNVDIGIDVHSGINAPSILKINHDKIENVNGTVLTSTGTQIPKGATYKFIGGANITQAPIGGGKGNVILDAFEDTRNNEITISNSHPTYKVSALHLVEGDYKLSEAGRGLILKTPDGTKNYRISVDNGGNIVTSLA